MSDISKERAVMMEAEWKIRKALEELSSPQRCEALMREYRLARADVREGIVLGLITRLAVAPNSFHAFPQEAA